MKLVEIMQRHTMRLDEIAASRKPKYDHIKDGFDAMYEIFKTHCSDSVPNVQNYKFIWRGDRGVPLKHGFAVADPSKTERKSNNTGNLYTDILSNHPAYASWPKRNRSFICSTNQDKAKQYGRNKPGVPSGHFEREVFAVIPFNGTKIGHCNQEDIWDTRIKIWGKYQSMHYIPRWLNIESYEELLELDKRLQSGDKKAILIAETAYLRWIGRKTDVIPNGGKSFVPDILASFNPAKLGFTMGAAPMMGINGEVWVGGQCLLIKMEYIKELVARVDKDYRK